MFAGRLIFKQVMDLMPLPTFRRCVSKYQGRFQSKNILVPRPISMHGFRPDYSSGKSARYRDLSAISKQEAVSYGHPRKSFKVDTCRCQRKARLANIRRIRTKSYRYSQRIIPRRLVSRRPGRNNICFGLNHDRPLLSVFPWAAFRKKKAAIKLHTLMDLRGSIPTFIHISDGKLHDVNALDLLQLESGAYYVMDRGYLDFERLHAFNQVPAFFVTRAKSNMKYKRRYSQPVDKETGLRCDQTIMLTGFYTRKHYPDTLRRVKYHDAGTRKTLVFLTNNFTLPAITITQLYRSRWQVELFFKWIKQHLRIKRFYGTSENAVKTQVWIAVSVYLLVAIMKKRLNLQESLYTILQILSVSVFEKIPIYQLVTERDYKLPDHHVCKQLKLF